MNLFAVRCFAAAATALNTAVDVSTNVIVLVATGGNIDYDRYTALSLTID